MIKCYGKQRRGIGNTRPDAAPSGIKISILIKHQTTKQKQANTRITLYRLHEDNRFTSWYRIHLTRQVVNILISKYH